MDMSKFVKSLSNHEINELQKCLARESVLRFNVSSFPPLNLEEIAILNTKGKVSAILAYRNRTSQTVLISKLVVENF